MPGVVNKELREALAILKNEGIGWADPEYASSDTVTRNYVISTDPVEGIELAPGQKVRLVVSLGPKPETVTMIPLIGQYVEDAETMLNELGLKLGQALPVTSEEEAGRIVWQSIESNQDVEVGTTVNVQYSKGTVTEPTQPPHPPRRRRSRRLHREGRARPQRRAGRTGQWVWRHGAHRQQSEHTHHTAGGRSGRHAYRAD